MAKVWGNYIYSSSGSGAYWCTGLNNYLLWEQTTAIAYHADCIVWMHWGWDVNANGNVSASPTTGVNDGITYNSWSGSIYSPNGQDTETIKTVLDVQYAKYYGQNRTATFKASNTVTGGWGNGTSTASTSVTFGARPYSAPSVPTSVSISGGGSTKPTIQWGAPSGQTGSTGAKPTTGFAIERRINDGSWTQIKTVAWNVYSYTDSGASTGNRYTYRIRTYNTGSNGAGGSQTLYSSYATTGTVYMTPTAPSSCSASRSSDTRINVSWAVSSVNATTGFYIDRSTDGGSYSRVATISSNATRSWADTSTSAYHKYQYRVCARNSSSTSGYATSGVVYTTPSKISGFTATRASDSQINLKWTNGKYYTSIALDRKVDAGSFSRLKDLSSTTTSYSDTAVSSNHKYTYQIQGWNGIASGAVSATVYTTPSAPTSCTAAKASNTSIKVSWGMGSNYTNTWQNVYVERQDNGGSWTQVASLSGTTSTWTDTGVSAGHKYAYRVRSHNTAGYSGYATSGTIQMGQTIHAYNSSGQVKVGLVTVYDSSGKLHQVKITVYDSSGKAHNVQ